MRDEPVALRTSMMRPIASAWAATVSSNFAGSPLTRMVMITDMDPSLHHWLRDLTDPIPGLETCGTADRPGLAPPKRS
jgi:hypothetical protein